MSKLRITGKYVPAREYYVFFSFGGDKHQCCTIIREENLERAWSKAWDMFGTQNVGRVECKNEKTDNKVKCLGFKLLEA